MSALLLHPQILRGRNPVRNDELEGHDACHWSLGRPVNELEAGHGMSHDLEMTTIGHIVMRRVVLCPPIPSTTVTPAFPSMELSVLKPHNTDRDVRGGEDRRIVD